MKRNEDNVNQIMTSNINFHNFHSYNNIITNTS